MLSVIREERHFAAQGNGGDGHVGVGKSLAFFLPVAAQQSGLPGDFRGDGQVFETVQEGRCFLLFARPETGKHLSDIYRATGKYVSMLHELVEEFGAAKSPVEMIENNGRIQQNE